MLGSRTGPRTVLGKAQTVRTLFCLRVAGPQPPWSSFPQNTTTFTAVELPTKRPLVIRNSNNLAAATVTVCFVVLQRVAYSNQKFQPLATRLGVMLALAGRIHDSVRCELSLRRLVNHAALIPFVR